MTGSISTNPGTNSWVDLSLLPSPKQLQQLGGNVPLSRAVWIEIDSALESIRDVFTSSLPNLGFEVHSQSSSEAVTVRVVHVKQGTQEYADILDQRIPSQAYVLNVAADGISIASMTTSGALLGFATFLQLLRVTLGFEVPSLRIVDGPDVEKRIISTPLTWYAGFARVGFGTQLWGSKQWIEYVDWCFLHKVNVINLVMYGFWPFELVEHPETVLRDIPVQTWSPEISDWITVQYTHPNVRTEFLHDVIKYANARGIDVYAYVGMNSYNGGYAVCHPEARMYLSLELQEKGHVNNYDSLCPSKPDVLRYLRTTVKRIEDLGFNGIVFEESEETQWFCQCSDCLRLYGHLSPNDAKHQFTVDRLSEYASFLKPETVIGIRWLREPPIIKDEAIIKAWADKLPARVKLFWAPGLEGDDSEFEKWVRIFGAGRIWSRNCEGSGFAASLGRIPYLVPDAFPAELKQFTFQHLWNDVAQFKGAIHLGCTGINGYGFEWYGHENYFMATAQFGWNAWGVSEAEYLDFSSRHFYGPEFGPVMSEVLKCIPCIHETQICDTLPPFAFMPTKYVGTHWIPYLEQCITKSGRVMAILDEVLSSDSLSEMQRSSIAALRIMSERMYCVANAGLHYTRFIEQRDATGVHEEQLRFAQQALKWANRDLDLIKKSYFDTAPHMWTGVPIGEYYVPMVINEYKKLFREAGLDFDPQDDLPYIFGGESLPWSWLLEWGPKLAIAQAKLAVQ